MLSLVVPETITHRRTAAGSWGTDGRYNPGGTTDTDITASVQPLSGRDRQKLPEGDRTRHGKKVYTFETSILFRTVDQHGQELADRFVIGGVVYEAYHVDDEHPLIPHTRLFLLRVDE